MRVHQTLRTHFGLLYNKTYGTPEIVILRPGHTWESQQGPRYWIGTTVARYRQRRHIFRSSFSRLWHNLFCFIRERKGINFKYSPEQRTAFAKNLQSSIRCRDRCREARLMRQNKNCVLLRSAKLCPLQVPLLDNTHFVYTYLQVIQNPKLIHYVPLIKVLTKSLFFQVHQEWRKLEFMAKLDPTKYRWKKWTTHTVASTTLYFWPASCCCSIPTYSSKLIK